MPTAHLRTETGADPEVNMAALRAEHQRLDATMRTILDEFMRATELERQYTVSASSTRLVWWLANPHTDWAESPLRIRLAVDPHGRAAAPVLAVDVQGAAEWVPQNVHTLGHILHRDTTYRVRIHGSQGNTDVWPLERTHRLHGRHSADAI